MSEKTRIEAVRKWFDDRMAKLRGKREKKIEEIKAEDKQPTDQPFRMFDSITVAAIPADAVAVAGYVNGNWPTYNEIVKKFPKAKHLSIAVTSSADAECLDVEPGDATPADVPAWYKRQKGHGDKLPVVYCGLAATQGMLNTIAKAGIKRSDIRLWTAHYTDRPHLCDSKCGFGLKTTADATQFTCKSGGRNLDESLCSPKFLN